MYTFFSLASSVRHKENVVLSLARTWRNAAARPRNSEFIVSAGQKRAPAIFTVGRSYGIGHGGGLFGKTSKFLKHLVERGACRRLNAKTRIEIIIVFIVLSPILRPKLFFTFRNSFELEYNSISCLRIFFFFFLWILLSRFNIFDRFEKTRRYSLLTIYTMHVQITLTIKCPVFGKFDIENIIVQKKKKYYNTVFIWNIFRYRYFFDEHVQFLRTSIDTCVGNQIEYNFYFL